MYGAFDGRANPNRAKGHLTVTGGEPFIRGDFLDLLQAFADNRSLFTFAILTNGSLIEQATASRLKKLKPSFVQVSMEGGQPTHDRIRGPGSFDQTVSAIRRLVERNFELSSRLPPTGIITWNSRWWRTSVNA